MNMIDFEIKKIAMKLDALNFIAIFLLRVFYFNNFLKTEVSANCSSILKS